MRTLRARVPLERDRDEIGLVPARAQLVDERVGEDLRAAARERHLRPADGDPHRCRALRARSASSCARSASTCSCEVVDQPQRDRVERALVVGDRLDVPAHQLAQHRLDGRAEPAADTGPQPQRAVGRDRPEPLGLVAERAPVGRRRATARIGARAAHLLAQPLEQRGDVNGPIGLADLRNPCRILGFLAVRGHPGILAPASAGTTTRIARVRVGLSLLTLVPGISGGSETYARALTRTLARVGTNEYEAIVPTLAPEAGGGLATVVATGYPALDAHGRAAAGDGDDGAPAGTRSDATWTDSTSCTTR